ncbi:hypothetical protein RN001_013282 [Aquatica leii]|uniref:5'-nucleotidase n=1 Tax=Aquatica leii TaxID=1421715 RepID=A0AAN7PRK6_9COLE|nr:hypothetical protein RN001_013282 [Aquatica leii]
MIAANIDFSQEYQLKLFDITKSWVFNINGTKIGVVGYTTPYTMQTAFTKNLLFTDEIHAIKLESEILHSAGIKTIIALGHSGFQTDLKIAREVPLVDLVIGGHTNTFLWNGPLDEWPEKSKGSYPTIVEQPNGKRVPVVQAYAFTKYMGRLTVIINSDGEIIDSYGLPQLLNFTVPQDVGALNLLEKYRPALQKLDKVIVGHSVNKLAGEASECKRHKCTLGNLITDAFVAYYKNEYNQNTIGMISTRTLYHDVVPKSDGSISMLDLLNALPYGGKVYSVSVTGADIWKTLEIGVSQNPHGTGAEFIHTSGIQYVYNTSRPLGNRIVQVKVGCDYCVKLKYQNIVFEKIYRVTVSEMLYKGLDFQTVIKENSFDVVQENKSELDIILWYLKKVSLVNNTVDDRIISLI